MGLSISERKPLSDWLLLPCEQGQSRFLEGLAHGKCERTTDSGAHPCEYLLFAKCRGNSCRALVLLSTCRQAEKVPESSGRGHKGRDTPSQPGDVSGPLRTAGDRYCRSGKYKGQEGRGRAQARDWPGLKGLVCWAKEFRENHVTPLRKMHIYT